MAIIASPITAIMQITYANSFIVKSPLNINLSIKEYVNFAKQREKSMMTLPFLNYFPLLNKRLMIHIIASTHTITSPKMIMNTVPPIDNASTAHTIKNIAVNINTDNKNIVFALLSIKYYDFFAYLKCFFYRILFAMLTLFVQLLQLGTIHHYKSQIVDQKKKKRVLIRTLSFDKLSFFIRK